MGELTEDGGLNPLETEVATVTAMTTTVTAEDTGSISLVDSTDVTVGTVDGQSDVVTGSGGSIVLRTVDGDVTVEDGDNDDGHGVTADGAGVVLLESGGSGDVIVQAGVSSGGGPHHGRCGRGCGHGERAGRW